MKMKMNPAGRERNGRREETDHLTCVIKTKDELNVRHGQPNFISGQVARSNGAVIIITALEHLHYFCFRFCGARLTRSVTGQRRRGIANGRSIRERSAAEGCFMSSN